MSGSSINTRRIISESMRNLMLEKPFAAISVKNICEKCGINRKSFYYHYRDKFDLVNDIYHSEFYDSASKRQYSTIWEFIDELSDYFCQNRKFYRNAFNVKGQNSFSECFCESLFPMFCNFLKGIQNTGIEPLQTGVVDTQIKRTTKYACVVFTAAIEYWLNDKNSVKAKEFAYSMRYLFDTVHDRGIRIKDYTAISALPYAYS